MSVTKAGRLARKYARKIARVKGKAGMSFGWYLRIGRCTVKTSGPVRYQDIFVRHELLANFPGIPLRQRRAVAKVSKISKRWQGFRRGRFFFGIKSRGE